MTVTPLEAETIVKRNLQGLKLQFCYARRKTQNAKLRMTRISARRSETATRKILNTAHKRFNDNVHALIEA
jgi:hypothetical protein